MRKFLPHIIVLTIIVLAFLVVPTSYVLAQEQTTTNWLAAGAAKMVLGSFDFVGVILSPLVIALVKVVSWITMLSGVVLNASIYYTVIAMSENIGRLPAIDITWTVIRDVANMGFIFMLLYSSIMTIVGRDKDTKGLIVKMVIAAVLVNFSLFFTKVIIDVTNLLALTFYKAIAPGALLGPQNFLNAGLSNGIIDALGTQKLWQMYGSIDSSVVLTSAVMTIIVLIVTTFIFSAMAVMFIVRYVALIFVLVLSPIMFLSMVFPGLSGYASKWKSTLIGQAVFAPVFMLMTWVTVILIQGISATVFTGMTSESLGNALSSTSFTVGAVPTLVNYVMIIIFLIASFTISKGVADQADGNINKLGKWAMGFAGGATAGTVGWAGRKSIGWTGSKIAENPNLINATKQSGMAGAGARLALYASKKAQSGSFDLRNATIPTESVGDLVRGTVGRTAIGRTIGANDLRTSSIEVGKPLAGLTGMPSADEKGYKELEKEKKTRLRDEKNASAREVADAEIERKIEAGYDAAKAQPDPNLRTNEQKAAIKDMVDAIKKVSEKEIENQKYEVLALQEVAEALSQKQFDAVEKSTNYSPAEFQNIKDARGQRLKSAFTTGAGVHIPARVATATTPATPGITGFEEAVKLMRKMDYTALAKLPAFDPSKLDVASFNNPGILEVYTPGLLGTLARQNDFTQEKKEALRNSIEAEFARITGLGQTPSANLQKCHDWLTQGRGNEIYS